MPNLDYGTEPGEQKAALRSPERQGEQMSFETISLLLNWLEMGALLAILFRLGRTFDLIASTQRELRRAIHHLGERGALEPGLNVTPVESRIAFGSSSPQVRAGAEIS